MSVDSDLVGTIGISSYACRRARDDNRSVSIADRVYVFMVMNKLTRRVLRTQAQYMGNPRLMHL